MTMTVKELLIAAKAKIQNRENWCCIRLAENAAGDDCYWRSSSAVRWCAIGAIASLQDSPIGLEACRIESEAMDTIVKHGGRTGKDAIKTHAEVLAAFDAAIASCP